MEVLLKEIEVVDFIEKRSGYGVKEYKLNIVSDIKFVTNEVFIVSKQQCGTTDRFVMYDECVYEYQFTSGEYSFFVIDGSQYYDRYDSKEE